MLQQHFFLALGWIVFCFLHSALATTKVKKNVAEAKPKWAPFYRLFYTLFAFATFGAVVIFQVAIASPFVFEPKTAISILGWLATALGALLMLVCIKKYFLSLSGLKSLFANKEVANNLRIDGVHRYVRHPLYLGTFVFIWGAWLVFPYLSLLISNIIITGYTLLGIFFEEKKLVLEFGVDYENYKKKVPRLIPFLRGFKRWEEANNV